MRPLSVVRACLGLRPTALALALACVLPILAHAQRDAVASTHPNAKHAQGYQLAIDSFKAGRYANAYGRAAERADAGHVPSARLALLIVQNGPSHFNTEFSATAGQVARWTALVVNAARNQVYVGADARTTE